MSEPPTANTLLPIGLLGVGSHSRREHIPALEACLQQKGSRFYLKAVCDLDADAAGSIASRLGAQTTYSSLPQMLASEKLAGLIAVTPTPATASVATTVMQAGLPLLMEKPLGVNMDEAQLVVDTCLQTGAKVMVGLNRRFDPVLQQTKRWLQDRPIQSFMVQLHRSNRLEKGFCKDVLPHPVDFLQSVLGPLQLNKVIAHQPGAGEAFTAFLQAGQSTHGVLQCLPHSAKWREEYSFAGPGFQIRAHSMDQCTGYAAGESAFTFQRDGGIEGSPTYQETRAFLQGLLNDHLPGPSPAEVIEAMRITNLIRG